MISMIGVATSKEATELSIPSGYVDVITSNDWLIDWLIDWWIDWLIDCLMFASISDIFRTRITCAVARKNHPLLTFCLQVFFNKISLLIHLLFLDLTCLCLYSYNLMLTATFMCRRNSTIYTATNLSNSYSNDMLTVKLSGFPDMHWRDLFTSTRR
jgi:hypothetical protein